MYMDLMKKNPWKKNCSPLTTTPQPISQRHPLWTFLAAALKSYSLVFQLCVRVCSAVSDSLQPHGLQTSRFLCPWNSPARILEWVAISSSRRSSWHRDQIWVSCVSCIGRQILSHCTTSTLDIIYCLLRSSTSHTLLSIPSSSIFQRIIF